MSALGFDIGNENCVIGAAKQRGIDVLLNDESKRETPTVVSFGEKQRFIGSAGAASATMNPKSTISQVKRLIGRKFSEPIVQDDLKLFPFETSEGPDGGIVIHLNYLSKKQTFTPIQILAMLLTHLKQIAERNLETPISDCVIGVPSYLTDLQRRAYLNAAEIAGLKPLRLMHDCTATALGYGIYKTEFSSGGPANVVFVDIGHCDMQVAVASFEPGHMKILSHASDSNLGGRDFDEVLFRYFAAQFKEQYNIDVYSNARASLRLRASCEKMKKVLSANPEAPLNIECLMEEKDVKGFIKREDFEKLSSELLERVSIPCRKALLDSGLTLEKIHTVELVGSGSRIPAIAKILNSLFGKEPRRTVNASECVARGCALQCAMLSPIFRVREYEVQDSFPFSIGFTSDEGPICTVTDGMLFPKLHPFPSLKMLSLHRSGTFHLEAFYMNQNELPSGVSTGISSFAIGPFKVPHVGKAKIKVRVNLSLHGIVTIESASLMEDSLDDSIMNGDAVSDKMEPDNQESSSKADGPAAVRRLEITIDENIFGGMTPHELSQAQEKELQLAQQDIMMERTKDKKNALESYVYEARNKILNTYRSFATDSEREVISSNLQQTEEWLYEDGDDESESVYTEKLEDLKKIVDPVEDRYKEEDARAQATRSLLNCIVEYRMAIGSLPPSERDIVTGECNKAEQWFREKTQQQDSLPKNADPILLSSEIKRKAEALEGICRHTLASKSSSARHKDNQESETRDERDDKQVD
ncbi:heat shock 70 kDa protein 16-like [Olea europaea var. sylvestris]|uniref:heat shock 70 kDa protein 16-like n=1 Tax=Olea europaea var. sylvestris TaxID=158386 RepID=UPI000C1D897F|nr:heat shock 70 kDa protein 16-like [Olea europaea var. sylvestris]XP_022877972.1 heat shock 70 kDa protein 16-like [Olea europaea var. sylvestris]